MKAVPQARAQRFLIVSLGSIGRRHLRNLRQLRPQAQIGVLRLRGGDAVPGADLVCASLDEVRAFAPQAAIIAAPASAHLAVGLALAQMGVALLIEKPFADRCAGLDQLMAAAAALPLMVGYNLRYKRSLIEARRRVLAGEIGRVLAVRAEVGQYLPDWRAGADYRASVSAQAELGGGALLELSHEIDYLYWMFGMPDWVSCRGGRYSDLEIDVEDTVELCLEYTDPPRLVSVHLDFVNRVTGRRCTFIGTEATLTWDGLQDRIEVAGPGGTDTVTLPMADGNATYLAELEDFLQCVDQGRPSAIDAVQAYNVLAIVEAAKAAMAGRTVERPLAYESR